MMVMHYMILLLLATTSKAFQFKVNILEDGYYSAYINGIKWLQSAPTYFIVDGKRKNSSDRSLKLNTTYTDYGLDQLGKFETTKFVYTAGKSVIECGINVYNDDIAVFSQDYLHGVEKSRPPSCAEDHKCYQETTGAFPSFFVQAVYSVDLGYLNFGASSMGDDRKIIGRWGTSKTRLNGGIKGGIIVIFDSKGHTLLMSPFNNFMSASFWHENVPPTAGGRINWGVMGGVKSIPDHKQSVILVAADSINKAFEKFGIALEKMYGTRAKRLINIQNDISLKYLGYWTDNGGYFYYYTERNKTYELTILDVYDYARKAKIPYRYIELDSWWYYQGYQGGVKQWTSRPDIFPDGIKSIKEYTKWPIAGHNRYWSIDNVYAKQNGGNYTFLIQSHNPRVAVPNDSQLWFDLLRNATKWGLIMYEQDWLDWETNHSDDLQEDLYLGEIWLKQMGQAADMYGLPIQYCMSLQRHALASIQIPAVTQTRVSTDYHLGDTQWRIGISSLFAHAIGFVPSKDNFATTSIPNGNPKYPNFIELWPALQIAVATLSMGPVGPSDAIGRTDRDLLMRCCNDEGLILKPSKPALAIDNQLIKKAMPESHGPDGEVWTTISNIFSDSSLVFGILFAANMTEQYDIKPQETGFPYKLYRKSRVYSFNKPMKGKPFDLLHGLTLSGCSNSEFCLYYFSPVFEPGTDDISIYGELNKYVPMSPQRITSIIVTDFDVIVDVTGVPSEKIDFAYELNERVKILSATFTTSKFMRLSLRSGVVDHRKI